MALPGVLFRILFSHPEVLSRLFKVKAAASRTGNSLATCPFERRNSFALQSAGRRPGSRAGRAASKLFPGSG